MIFLGLSFLSRSASLVRQRFRHDLSRSSFLSLSAIHIFDGMAFEEVRVDLEEPSMQFLTILEASIESQEMLIDIALEREDVTKDRDRDRESSSDTDKHDNIKKREKELDGNEFKEDPYGAVLWPSSRLVSKRLLRMQRETEGGLSNLSIIELGSGAGLTALVALKGGCLKYLATDYNPVSLQVSLVLVLVLVLV